MEISILRNKEIPLWKCPPGLFLFEGSLGFKTEYGAITGKDIGNGKVEWIMTGGSDVYCVSSGEVFCGPAKTHEERENLLVTPVNVEDLKNG
jgi:hypothetical protein